MELNWKKRKKLERNHEKIHEKNCEQVIMHGNDKIIQLFLFCKVKNIRCKISRVEIRVEINEEDRLRAEPRV